jgi:hypothetical protein
MSRLLSILTLFLWLGVSAQVDSSFQVSKAELVHFLNDFYNGNKLFKKIKFERIIYQPLRIEIVKKYNAEFEVFDETDWVVINNQIDKYKVIELDTSYIPNADFVDKSNLVWATLFASISFPLFNTAKNVCILFVTISGGLDPDEGIQIYKKEGPKWNLYKSLL